MDQEPEKSDYFTNELCDLGQVTESLQFPLYLLIKWSLNFKILRIVGLGTQQQVGINEG